VIKAVRCGAARETGRQKVPAKCLQAPKQAQTEQSDATRNNEEYGEQLGSDTESPCSIGFGKHRLIFPDTEQVGGSNPLGPTHENSRNYGGFHCF
jgi:hypothetical protein